MKLVLIFILGMACAVSYIHSQYLAHLDIKPQNILLTESGSPKLANFGSAMYFKKLGRNSQEKTTLLKLQAVWHAKSEEEKKSVFVKYL